MPWVVLQSLIVAFSCQTPILPSIPERFIGCFYIDILKLDKCMPKGILIFFSFIVFLVCVFFTGKVCFCVRGIQILANKPKTHV